MSKMNEELLSVISELASKNIKDIALEIAQYSLNYGITDEVLKNEIIRLISLKVAEDIKNETD